MNNGKLPKGWRMVRFGEVVRDVNEAERNPLDAGLERFVGLEHIEPENLHLKQWGNLADGDISFTKRFRKGQVLFGKRRAYQRKVAVAEFDGICSSDILTFEPKGDDLLPELLPFIVQSEGFFDHALGTSSGSLSPRTRWSQLQDFEFPLPPKDTQRQIADILTAAVVLKAAIAKTEQAATKLQRAWLRETFAPSMKHPELHVAEAGEVQLGRRNAPEYRDLKITRPYLRVANVLDGYIDYSDVLTMQFNEREVAAFTLRTGDILLNEGQSAELVGRSAVYRGDIGDCCYQSTLLRFRPGPGVLTEWAQAYFQYCRYVGIFAAISPQTTSMAHLTADRFKKMKMPVPPIKEQERYVAQYERILRMQIAVGQNKKTLTSLAAALSDSLVKGQLCSRKQTQSSK